MILLAWFVEAALMFFTARRYVHWVASCFAPRPCAASRTKSIVVLVAARNEERHVPRLLAALLRGDYPRHLLSFVLVDDGSSDSTSRLFQEWCATQAGAQWLNLPERAGKAGALAAGLSMASPSDLVVVMDADTEPAPDALAQLAGAFEDPSVGAAGGYPQPVSTDVSMTARYAALERWVYHLVVLAGKDRLGSNPPVIGALCAFRLDVLVAMGGFPTGTVAEDICASMAVVNRGSRTRWVRAAVTREDVPSHLRQFYQQRMRWSRGLLASRRFASGIEDFLVVTGYLDRLALAGGIGLALLGRIPFWLPVLYLMAPAVTVLTALKRAGVSNKVSYLLAAAPMLLVDVAITAASGLAHLVGMPVEWSPRPEIHVTHPEVE